MKNIINGVAAGVMIAIGGTVYLSCETKYVGAILFSVALLCICYRGYALFTGKVGFLIERHDKKAFSVLFTALAGNAAATCLLGRLLRRVLSVAGETARTLCEGKLDQVWWQTLVRAVFCGILMYLAVAVYRDQKSPIGILFCVPVFILAGFEHSIADMFYFAASGMVSGKAFVFLWIVIFGNATGALLMALLERLSKEKANPIS